MIYTKQNDNIFRLFICLIEDIFYLKLIIAYIKLLRKMDTIQKTFEVTKRLSLNDLFSTTLVNKSLSSHTNNQHFWQVKLEHDYDVTSKKEYQTWLERYKLAKSMGNICIQLDYELSNDYISDNITKINIIDPDYSEMVCDIFMFNIRAINVVIKIRVIYYLTDELELYGIDEFSIAEDEHKLIASNVTDLISEVDSGIYCIIDSDLYVLDYDPKMVMNYASGASRIIPIASIPRRLTYDENISYISELSGDTVTCYTYTDKILRIHCYDKVSKGIKIEELSSKYKKIISSQNDNVILTNDGKIISDTKFDIDEIPKIINMFGSHCDIILLTDERKAISFCYTFDGSDSCGSLSDEEDCIYGSEFKNNKLFSDVPNIDKIYIIGQRSCYICVTTSGDMYISNNNKMLKMMVKPKRICGNDRLIIII